MVELILITIPIAIVLAVIWLALDNRMHEDEKVGYNYEMGALKADEDFKNGRRRGKW